MSSLLMMTVMYIRLLNKKEKKKYWGDYLKFMNFWGSVYITDSLWSRDFWGLVCIIEGLCLKNSWGLVNITEGLWQNDFCVLIDITEGLSLYLLESKEIYNMYDLFNMVLF